MSQLDDLAYLFQHTAAMTHRQADQVLQERLGIGMAQFKILGLLERHPGMPQNVLAARLGQTEASISRQMKVLQEKGMLEVMVNPKNRRQHNAATTPKGMKLTAAAREVLATYHAPVFAQFNEKQQRLLADVLDKMHQQVCRPGRAHACVHVQEGA